jgi:acetyl esterase/lipase
MSWQIQFFYLMLRVLRCWKFPPLNFKARYLRKMIEAVVQFVRYDKRILVEKITIQHMQAEWLIPPEAHDLIIFYLHGGAYFFGSTQTHKDFLMQIACGAKVKIFAINYRLAPESLFPTAIEDALLAYRWLLENKFAANKIIIAGDSAGGGLAMATLVALREATLPLPCAAVLLSPWVDLALTGKSMRINKNKDLLINEAWARQAVKFYLNDIDPKNALASPLYAHHEKLPPLFIQVGGAEILLSDSIRLAKKAKAAGVQVILDIWPKMIHGWHFFGRFIPESRQAIMKINQFIKNFL